MRVFASAHFECTLPKQLTMSKMPAGGQRHIVGSGGGETGQLDRYATLITILTKGYTANCKTSEKGAHEAENSGREGGE